MKNRWKCFWGCLTGKLEQQINPAEKNPDSDEHKQPSGDENERRIASEIRGFKDAIIRQTHAQRKTDRRDNNCRNFRETATVILLIFTTGFVGYQDWIYTQQLEVSRDTEIRQLRPYLFASPNSALITIFNNGTGTVKMAPGIKVFGQTMAGSVAPEWELKVAEYPMTDKFKFEYILQHAVTDITVPPGQEYPAAEKTLDISADDVRAISAGTKRIYMDGTVLYIDIFGIGRWTNFCYTTTPEMMKNHNFDTCPTHNKADWNQVSKKSPAAFIIPM